MKRIDIRSVILVFACVNLTIGLITGCGNEKAMLKSEKGNITADEQNEFIEVCGEGYKTEKGLTIGDTLDNAKYLYPNGDEIKVSNELIDYTVPMENGDLLFRCRKGTIESFALKNDKVSRWEYVIESNIELYKKNSEYVVYSDLYKDSDNNYVLRLEVNDYMSNTDISDIKEVCEIVQEVVEDSMELKDMKVSKLCVRAAFGGDLDAYFEYDCNLGQIDIYDCEADYQTKDYISIDVNNAITVQNDVDDKTIKDSKQEIKSCINSRVSKEYLDISVSEIRIDDSLVQVYLSYDIMNTKETTKKMIKMYSEDLGATVGKECSTVEKLVMYWTVPYLDNATAKISCFRKNGAMYGDEEVFASSFDR